MIKKLSNHPYAPKVEQAPKWEQRGRKKKRTSLAALQMWTPERERRIIFSLKIKKFWL
jgi:hypothetical protein